MDVYDADTEVSSDESSLDGFDFTEQDERTAAERVEEDSGHRGV